MPKGDSRKQGILSGLHVPCGGILRVYSASRRHSNHDYLESLGFLACLRCDHCAFCDAAFIMQVLMIVQFVQAIRALFTPNLLFCEYNRHVCNGKQCTARCWKSATHSMVVWCRSIFNLCLCARDSEICHLRFQMIWELLFCFEDVMVSLLLFPLFFLQQMTRHPFWDGPSSPVFFLAGWYCLCALPFHGILRISSRGHGSSSLGFEGTPKGRPRPV